jgi:hypothetical protein
MPASKDRLRWESLPEPVRVLIEELACGRVASATNCAGLGLAALDWLRARS